MGTVKGTDVGQPVDTETVETPATTANQAPTQLAAEISEPAKVIADRATQIANNLLADLTAFELQRDQQDSEPIKGPGVLTGFALLDALEDIKEEVGAACLIAAEGVELPIEFLTSYTRLGGNEEAVIRTILEYFEVDLSSAEVVREYEQEVRPTSPLKGPVRISVIKTNTPEVFLGRWEYPNGTVAWTIRPLEVKKGNEDDQ